MRGAEIELMEMVEGEFRALEAWKFELERVRVREMVRRAEETLTLTASLMARFDSATTKVLHRA